MWPVLLAFALLAGAVAGGLALHRIGADDNSGGAAAGGSTAAPGADLSRRSAGIDEILNRRAGAVRDGKLADFLADVDPDNATLVSEQRVLFRNLVQFGFSRVGYEQLREQFDQSLVDRYGPSTYVVQVAMTYQLRGINPAPVRTLLGYTFLQRADGRWMLVNDTDLDQSLPAGSHQEAWDVGPVLVRRAPRVLVVVEPGANDLAAGLLAKAGSAVRAVSRRWPGGWAGAGVVIALDDKLVRGADYTRPKNAEDALAMATWVYRTLPGEVTAEGGRADSYVVVNPRNRAKVDARTLAHEFTHVATARYGAYAPRWLVEGTATYVEFLPMDGEPDLALQTYRDRVRTKILPKAKGLPADALFFKDPATTYPLAWLAADRLFDRFGAAKVGAFYREIAAQGISQPARNRIMLEHLGLTEAALLRSLAGQES